MTDIGGQAFDRQAHAVYAWERDFIEKAVGPEIMGRDQCENLVRRAAAALGQRAPTIEYLLHERVPCRADPARHRLLIASWGRAHVTLLHEMAHLGSWPSVALGEAAHGPTFVGCAMTLYNRFLGIPLDRLEETARMRGIQFVPALRPALAVPPSD